MKINWNVIIKHASTEKYRSPMRFVLGLEMVGPSKRVWAGIVIHVFFAIGLLYLVGAGFLLRDWQYISLAIAGPCVFYLSYWL